MKIHRLLAAAACALAVFTSHAQTEAQFSLIPLQNDELGQTLSSTVDNKLRQALTRTMALSESSTNPFAIEPKLEFSEAAETEGLVMEVGRVKADLSLVSLNTIDGTVFHSVSIPLTGSATGGKSEAMKKMVNSLKPTDPAFVRFVRKSREKIADYYASNCAVIMQQAQNLVQTGRVQDAMNLLKGIAPSVDCYDAAAALLAQLSPAPQEEPAPEPVPVTNDTVYVEKIVETVVEVPSVPDTVIVEKPVPAAPAATPAPQPQSSCKIKLSDPDSFSFRLVSCRGLKTGEQIKFVGEITNKNLRNDSQFIYFNKAISENGYEFSREDLSVRGQYSAQVSMPRNVPVKVEFIIKDVKPDTDSLAYLHIDFGQYTVEIYNLPVNWE